MNGSAPLALPCLHSHNHASIVNNVFIAPVLHEREICGAVDGIVATHVYGLLGRPHIIGIADE